jgi:hypothetical protein
MPVDRELSYECLKWVDPKVYKMYLNLRYRGMTREQVEKDPQSFYKLKMLTLLNDTLDELEERGVIQITNDYVNERILVKENQVDARSDGDLGTEV